jgi:hypothetical protein
MPCDPAELLADAKCYLACIPPGLAPWAEIALLCALRDGDTAVCASTGSVITAARCLECSIPLGMTPYVKMALLCNIINGL